MNSLYSLPYYTRNTSKSQPFLLYQIKEENMKKHKIIALAVALVAILALLATGTFA